jgi:hypothetical protein
VTGAFDYARTRATAERLIARFGQTGALRRMVSNGDVFNPELVATDYACTFAVLDYAKRDIDGTLIRQTDQQIYLSTQGLTVVPDVTDKVVVGGSPMTIINVAPIAPSGAAVYYELQVRK